MPIVNEGADVSITIDSDTGSESLKHCIFKVHNGLRNVNEKAYEPEIIAIGPYHRKKSHLQMMEAHKFRYQKLLLQRKTENLSTYLDAIKPLEKEARKCYAEPIDLYSPDEFVEMMVLDGCFIIELFSKFDMFIQDKDDPEDNIKNDPLFRMPWALTLLQRDLMLFENQLPFSILSKLYEVVELPGKEYQFKNLALKFFNDLHPGHGKIRKIGVNHQDNCIKHLLDFIYRNWWSETKLQLNTGATWNIDTLDLIRCSTELAEAGIKFEKIDEVSFDIQFNNGLLRIPILTIEGRTESVLRNLLAYEQYCGDGQFNIVTDYMTFFSCLIKSKEDVAKLSRRGIVRSFLGDDEVVCQMFRTMTDHIVGPSKNFRYGEICKRVNIHYKGCVNKWMSILKRKYMHSPWGIISILAAIALLLLALLQDVFQIWSWKKT